MRTQLLVIALACTTLGGCATTYTKNAPRFLVQATTRDAYSVLYMVPLGAHDPSAQCNLFVMLRAADLALDESMGFFTIEAASLVGGTPPGWSKGPYLPERDVARLRGERAGSAMLTVHLYNAKVAAAEAVAANSAMAHPFVYDAREVA